MTDQTKEPKPKKPPTEVQVMQKIEALIDGLSVPAQGRIVEYFGNVVGERMHDARCLIDEGGAA
jgi:hypothetical protein